MGEAIAQRTGPAGDCSRRYGQAEREALLLAEIERAARYAMAHAPASTRMRLSELAEHGIFMTGRAAQRAPAAAVLLAGALHTWPGHRMAAELPHFKLLGDEVSRLLFWGWVAELTR